MQKQWKSKNPFKESKLFEKEIETFLNNFKSNFAQYGSKINVLFEMSVLNYMVKYYEKCERHVEVRPQNLKEGVFRYKIKPQGYPENFSFFTVCIQRYNRKEKKYIPVESFEIRSNLPIESRHEKKIFITPDISVVDSSSITEMQEKAYGYGGTSKFFYVPAPSVKTFVEVKHYTPFPELVFSFIGLVNEILPSSLTPEKNSGDGVHLCPSLVISGKANRHLENIKESLTKRYGINIFFEMFHRVTQLYSKESYHKEKRKNL